jgi:hypothetical protein
MLVSSRQGVDELCSIRQLCAMKYRPEIWDSWTPGASPVAGMSFRSKDSAFVIYMFLSFSLFIRRK